MNTGGNNKSAVVPNVKNENEKKTFMLLGAKVFNMIPAICRTVNHTLQNGHFLMPSLHQPMTTDS